MYFKKSRVTAFFVVLGALLAGELWETLAADNHPVQWVRREKIRMGWSPSVNQYKAMSDAGMNTVMPRLELDAVVKYKSAEADRPLSKNDALIIKQLQSGAHEAKRLGLKYFHCIDLAAQYQTVQVGFKNNPARFNDGNLPSPVDPVYWQRAILQRVRRVLDLLDDANVYAIDGVIIDPEMYTLSGAVPGSPDYGQYAFETFLKETNRPVPPKVDRIEARERWLSENNLDKQFVQWQFDRIASMARELRQLVHSRRPNAILGFIIYKNKLWFNAMAKGLATSSKPVFIGPESTYSGVMDESFIQYVRGIRKTVAVPCIIVPGIRMGIENGIIPYNLLKVLEGNIYQRCRYSDGYWVWAIYRFGKKEQQSVFFKTLSLVNAGLDHLTNTGQLDPELKAQPLPSTLPQGFASLLKQALQSKPLPSTVISPKASFQVPHLRGLHILAMWPKPKEQATVTIRTVKLGSYLDQGNVQIFDEKGKLLWQDFVTPNSSKIFRIPETSGTMCAVVISAGMNAYCIQDFNCPALLISTSGLSLNAQGQGGRFFFFVPPGKKNFALKLHGHAIETAVYTLHDPTGKVVRRWEKLSRSRTDAVKVTEPGIWYMDATDLVDDAGFGLVDIPNIFALRPEDLRKN